MAISKHDKQALADLFIHMGVPLVVAIQTVESWSGGDAEPQTQRAEKLAKLLNISVEFATKITKKLEIRDAYTLENVRGKIMRIVTPLVADFYVKNGETPSQEALQGLTDLFDALLSFADSVSPTDEKGSKPTKMALMIEACEPLLTAIRDNSLDMEEQQIFQESVSGLKARAEQLAAALGQDHAIEGGLFRALVRVYVSCYDQIAERGGMLEDVWNECDQRLVLIHGLAVFVSDNTGIPKGAANPPASEGAPKSNKGKAQKEADKKPVKKEESAQSEAAKKAEDKGEATESQDDEDDGDFNPMSFFSAG